MPGEERPMQKILLGMAVSILAALVTALQDFEAPTGKLLRTLAAGVIFGVIVTILLMDVKMDLLYKGALIGLCAASVSTIWPQVKQGTKKIFVIDRLLKIIKFLKGDDDDTLPNS